MSSLKLSDFEIPSYNLDFSRPIQGVGCFATLAPKKVYCKDIDGLGFACRIDRSIVLQKKLLWDKVLESKILESDNPDDELLRLKALQLLKDKSIMAYHFFKLDGKPVECRFYQDVLLNDRYPRILYAASNQSGKSTTLDIDAATEFISDHGKGWIGAMVSKSLNQSQFRMASIKALLKSSNIDIKYEETDDTKTGRKDNTVELTYTFYDSDHKPLYTNRLICCPPTGSALGYPIDDLWLDEFEFWENVDQEMFIYQIAIPRTFHTHGRIKIYSNPDGRKMLSKLFNLLDRDGKSVWHRYQFNYWDTPGASQEGFDFNCTGMTKQRIESTLLAIFGSAGGAVFSNDEIADQIDIGLAQKGDMAGFGKETAWFLDVGAVHDQSVLCGGFLESNPLNPDIPKIMQFYTHKYPVGYPLGRVVGIPITDPDGWEDEAVDNPSVKDVLTQYAINDNDNNDLNSDSLLSQNTKVFNQPLFGFDITGNQGMLPLFQAAGIDAVDITFSGKRKWQMYQCAQYYAQQRLWKRNPDRDRNTIDGKDGNYQFSRLIITPHGLAGKRTNYEQVHHASEEDFDDVPDASVGLIHIIENPDISTLNFDVIGPNGSIYNEEVINPDETERQKRDRLLKEQYIPKFMQTSQFNDWMDNKMENRR